MKPTEIKKEARKKLDALRKHCVVGEDATTWAYAYLVSQGYTINNPPLPVTSTPWSVVIRFDTKQGAIYLKQSIRALFIEVNIIQMIEEQVHDNVPEVIAVNHELHCFLMKDSGINLRTVFKQKFDPDLFATVIQKYTAMQCAMTEKSNALIDIGVPDWRLKNFPHLYHEFMKNDALLNEIGMTEDEKRTLRSLEKNVVSLCEQLETYKIKETLDHADFHDNNILTKDGKVTVIDLGEIVVSHPFFSLHSCLFFAKYWGDCEENDPIYLKLKNACLHSFKQWESEKNLLEIFDLTHMLHSLYYVFTVDRLISLCAEEGFRDDFVGVDGEVKTLASQKNNILGCLREFIAGQG